ncbi:hypothetical protein OsI_32810 [Oryza sativa Indica Group]|uniref:Wall-associated receptor kinase domain-containing protein n=1 Tax=Oryza sativa subsp. indica TaxID=39946 RepID=B8BFT7_ORYSI|nr:hypothetical protein OsI_32810 [Oryza sativa Indica Group]
MVDFNRDGMYRISHTRNHLVVLGCNTLGYVGSQRRSGVVGSDYDSASYTGCLCYCNDSSSAVSGDCDGVGCCQVNIPPDITDNTVSFDGTYSHERNLDYSPCDYAFLVEKDNYTFSTADLRMNKNRTMPVRLDWAIRDNLTCSQARKTAVQVSGYACILMSVNSRTLAMVAAGTSRVPLNAGVPRVIPVLIHSRNGAPQIFLSLHRS